VSSSSEKSNADAKRDRGFGSPAELQLTAASKTSSRCKTGHGRCGVPTFVERVGQHEIPRKRDISWSASTTTKCTAQITREITATEEFNGDSTGSDSFE